MLGCKVERVLERQFLTSSILLVLVLKTINCSLYFGVTAKPGIAKDLIERNDIGRKTVADFIDLLLVENLTKTDKSKLPHGLQLHIKPTLDWPCSAAHNFDGNAKLHSVISFPVTFKDLMEPIFNQALKAGHVGFVTDTIIYTMFKQQPIKSYKHSRSG